jgi:hypothetical protein
VTKNEFGCHNFQSSQWVTKKIQLPTFDHQSKQLMFFGLPPNSRADLKKFGIYTKFFNRSIKNGHQSNNLKKIGRCPKTFQPLPKKLCCQLGLSKNSITIFGCHNW